MRVFIQALSWVDGMSRGGLRGGSGIMVHKKARCGRSNILTVDYHDENLVIRWLDGATGEERMMKIARLVVARMMLRSIYKMLKENNTPGRMLRQAGKLRKKSEYLWRKEIEWLLIKKPEERSGGELFVAALLAMTLAMG